MTRRLLDAHDEAAAALLAGTATSELSEIGRIGVRLGTVVRRLEKFSFPLVAAPLAGLLTRRENHTASGRIEALIHLAAVACRGEKAPEQKHLRDWLNVAVYNDVITELEIPVEDVFVSNVDAWFGNARLFSGRWENNAEYVRACLDTLMRIGDRTWAAHSLKYVEALLRVSEAVAERAGIARYSCTESRPGEKIAVGVSILAESKANVGFSDKELRAIGVEPGILDPFMIQGEHAELLAEQSLGHSELERRPLVRWKGRTWVVLPTAMGAAIRRFVLERATAAGDLRLFQSTWHLARFSEAFMLGRADWGIEYVEMLEPDPDDGLREFVGTFDDGGYVHFVFVPDEFDSVAEHGLRSTHAFEAAIKERLQGRAAVLEQERDYRRGLTVLVDGGIGRNFSPVWGDLPSGWHQLCVSAPDFMFLGAKSDFTALRAWKLLQQVDDLEERGVVFPNLRGFTNLVAFAYYADFELVPANMNMAPMYLHSDLMLPLRHPVRTAMDRHASPGPDGDHYISVQCQETDGRLNEADGRAVFLSPGHRAEGKVLACVETSARPWWVRCDEVQHDVWHRGIAFFVLDMILGWLGRLAPALEERYTSLPDGPVVLQIRFPNIEAFSRHDVEVAKVPVAPAVVVDNGAIVIDCMPDYLRSFLSPGNVGDRLMVSSLVRGVNLLCAREVVSDAAMKEFIRSVVGSESARYLKMTPSETPEDVIYDMVALPDPRLLMPEDLGWSRLDLARRAGYEGKPGIVSSSRAGKVLNASVDVVWERVRSRLRNLSRESVIQQALLNYVAVCKEHRDWMRSMEAQLALFGADQAMEAANERVFRRDGAGLASRVIAEMALCTAPHGDGSTCTKIDLDFLIAEVSTLLECASQSDAWHYGLATRPPAVNANGSFDFDASATQATAQLMSEHWRRTFLDAEQDEQPIADDALPHANFSAAFAAEFGLTPEQYATFVRRVALEAVELGKADLRLRRSTVVQRLRDAGVANPEWAFERFALAPRERWDESEPKNATARDWYPWRYARRLSILRRPLVQLSREGDPVVIVLPSILAGTLGYLGQAGFGELPETLFDSAEMIACVGMAANRIGHEFTRRVAERLGELKWETEQELSLTRFGGSDSLGDVDVLAWKRETGLVFAIECKSLRFDRSLGEVGERLVEYSVGPVGSKRTPLQKHLDRMTFLETNRERLANYTGIGKGDLQLRSGLVTENLVSMQFGGIARERLDLVTDFELLEDALLN